MKKLNKLSDGAMLQSKMDLQLNAEKMKPNDLRQIAGGMRDENLHRPPTVTIQGG